LLPSPRYTYEIYPLSSSYTDRKPRRNLSRSLSIYLIITFIFNSLTTADALC
jgi:hypothetical protein